MCHGSSQDEQRNTILEQLKYFSLRHAIKQDINKHIRRPQSFQEALEVVGTNKGASTPGINKETIQGYTLEKLEELRCRFLNGQYKPLPVREVFIPKPDGQQRSLGIPTFSDRIIQEVIRKPLEVIFENTFSASSYGFRPNKDIHQALKHFETQFQGVNYLIEFDIKNCFGTIDHQLLLNSIKKKMRKAKVISIIKSWLKAGVMKENKIHTSYTGTPQGGIISPLLANIYLNNLDQYITKLKKKYDNNKGKTKTNPKYNQIRKRMGKMKGKEEYQKEYQQLSKEITQVQYLVIDYRKRLEYIRYADDFIIGVKGTYGNAVKIKNLVEQELKQLKLETNSTKTRIVRSDKGIHFLGYNLKIRRDPATKRDKNGVKKRCWDKKTSTFNTRPIYFRKGYARKMD